MVGVGGVEGPAGSRDIAGALVNRPSEHLHDGPPARLLAEARTHHENLGGDPEAGAGIGEGGPPLAGPGFRGQGLHSFPGREMGLHDGRVRLVASHGADALVLVKDPGGRVEVPGQGRSVDEGSGPEHGVGLQDGFGYRHLPLESPFMGDEPPGEDRLQVFGFQRLTGGRMQGRTGQLGQVRLDVVIESRQILGIARCESHDDISFPFGIVRPGPLCSWRRTRPRSQGRVRTRP